MKTAVKIILFFSLYFWHADVIAQNRITDTSATCIAYWKNGESKVYQIKHSKERFESGKPKSVSEGNYEAHLRVIDSSESGFTVEWIYKNFKTAGADQHALNSLMTIMDQLKIVFKTDDVGSFSELVNWEEVRDIAFSNYEKATLKLAQNKEFVAALSQIKSIFSSKENIQTALIQEVQIFQSPYGVEYSSSGTVFETVLPNITGGSPFPATITLKLDILNTKEDFCSVSMNQSIDKGKAGPILADMLKRLSSTPVQEEEIKKEIADLEISDINEYDYSISSGWINSIKYIRTAKVGTLKQIETYLISLKK